MHTQCVVNPPTLSVRFPSRQAPPGRQCALTLQRDICQSAPSPLGISECSHLLTLLRVPQTYHRAKGQQGPALPVCWHARLGLGAAGNRSGRDTDTLHHVYATCSDYLTAFHPGHKSFLMRFHGLPSLNRATSIWNLSQADEDAIIQFPSLCFCNTVPVYEGILALDSTEHTCWLECQAKEHLLWSVAAGKLFHFNKTACGITMA